MEKQFYGIVRDNPEFSKLVELCKAYKKGIKKDRLSGLFNDQPIAVINIFGALEKLSDAYVLLHEAASMMESQLEQREQTITRLQQQLSDKPADVHREKPAVRRNWLARAWQFITLRG